ncbi:MAG: DNA polymerase III subunit gamma/tau [Burkholderiaceae bacterium]|nr:DNA polymerase III subunit gamma/tau [Burkholderiaceae bacterium]
MTYLVLARKWRPRSFDTLVGQDHVVRALTHALSTQRLHHAWLFTGTRGVGKTTLSRILAKSLNCINGITPTPCGVCQACTEIDAGRFVDYIELDAASNRGVDEMTQLLDQAVYAPSSGRYKVYMIDEVHMLSGHAFNAMLKTLEEPPPHVKFILATTDPQKIPVTVLSRCLQFNLKQMAAESIVGYLDNVLGQENIPFELPALRLLAQAASGSMRDALSLTDQAIAYSAGHLTAEAILGMLGAIDQRHLVELLQALATGQAGQVLDVANQLAERGLSYSGALADLAVLLSRIAIEQRVPGTTPSDDPQSEDIARLAQAMHPDQIQLFYSVAVHSRNELSLAPDEYAGFVMACLRMLSLAPAADPAVIPPAPVPVAAPAVMPPTPTPTPVQAVASIAASVPESAPAPAPASVPEAQAVPEPVPVSTATPDESMSATEELSAGDAVVEPDVAMAIPPTPTPEPEPIASPVLAEPTPQPAPPAQPLAPAMAAPAPAAEVVEVPAWEELPVEPQPVASPQVHKSVTIAQPPADNDSDFETLSTASPDVGPGNDDADFDTDLHFERVDDDVDMPMSDEQAETLVAPVFSASRKKTKAPKLRAMTQQAWPALVATLPLTGLASGLAAELARQSEWLDVQGDTIHLRVAVQTLADGPGKVRLQTLLSEHFGAVVQLHVEYGATGDETAHAVALARKAERQKHAEGAALVDPFVQALIAGFGARIMPGSVSATPG